MERPMVSVNCFNGVENMFIGGVNHISKLKNWDEEFGPTEIVNTIIENCGQYSHHYEEGDMLIWDNV
jgi:hypothetical protein